ncbi:MAG: hypothetical protein KZQ65_12665, partial [Candidatus Thiodiazotropha sp. (ex Gloverina cf. vestifex)]|nr:hypothetical protein [Candidatus Thiodiazotropha sp. (ex Gloverina cf. vestifex)]
TVTITAIQPRLRLSGTNRLGFQPSMAISVGLAYPGNHLSAGAHFVLVGVIYSLQAPFNSHS